MVIRTHIILIGYILSPLPPATFVIRRHYLHIGINGVVSTLLATNEYMAGSKLTVGSWRYLGMGFLRMEGVCKIVKSGDLICSDLAADADGIRTFVHQMISTTGS